ncbi:MAG: response regulator [Chloroflexota bacterium]
MAEILIVDDEAVAIRILQHTLTKNGHIVQSANSGEEALRVVSNTQFDLMILDVSMPVMDGIELLTELRALPAYADTPIIMLTASSQDDDRVRAREAGANLYLTKPFSSRDMIRTVDNLLSGR